VLFDHDGHRQRLGGEASCGRCHHRNLPLDRGTPCTVCHADMYRCTDTFDHQNHVAALGANDSCRGCHRDPAAGKTRATATPCFECHTSDITDCSTEERHHSVSQSHVSESDCSGCHDFDLTAMANNLNWHRERCGIAPGYRLAMHRLCIECHCVEESKMGIREPYLSRCSCCHRSTVSEVEVLSDLMVSSGLPESGSSSNEDG
jgi:hypothetical protein